MFQNIQRFQSILRLKHLVTFALQIDLNSIRNRMIIVNNQNFILFHNLTSPSYPIV